MRKSGLIAATLAASVGMAGVAQAVDVNQTTTVKVTGKKGTKAKPSALKLNVTTGTSAVTASQNGTFATKTAVIHFDKNIKFNNTKFPTCDLPTVTRAPEDCPAGSKIGTGFAKASIGPNQIKANPTVTAYNAAGGKLNLKLTKAANEVDSSGVLTATLKTDKGKFGSKLNVVIPSGLQQPAPGLFVTLTEFNTVISTKKYKGLSYAYSVGCTGGKYSFAGDFNFTDGSSASAKSTSKC